jgi:hypothetical protein
MALKKTTDKIIRKLVNTRIIWPIFYLAYRFAYRFKFEKELIEIEKRRDEIKYKGEKLRITFSDLAVKEGPFKGMKYPDFIAHGSAMFPKLLGSYESELYPEIERLLKNDYHHIVDIGCAEGYYAVGFAMRKGNATVYAYDTNQIALEACRKMAVINGVEKQMHFRNFCSADSLMQFDFTNKSLIISDCEGYEIELFTSLNVKNLSNCDLIIELHDLFNEKISPTIEELFKKSHNIKFIYSENTFKKMKKFNTDNHFTDEEIDEFFVERPGIIQWAIITSR